MRLRAAVGRALEGVLAVVLAIGSGTLPVGSLDDRDGLAGSATNGHLVLRSARHIRRMETARFAESIGTSPWALYLTGVRVVVDTSDEAMRVYNGSGAVDTLVWFDRSKHLVQSGRWRGRGPVLGLFLDRP